MCRPVLEQLSLAATTGGILQGSQRVLDAGPSRPQRVGQISVLIAEAEAELSEGAWGRPGRSLAAPCDQVASRTSPMSRGTPQNGTDIGH